jgi:hypothetical protein
MPEWTSFKITLHSMNPASPPTPTLWNEPAGEEEQQKCQTVPTNKFTVMRQAVTSSAELLLDYDEKSGRMVTH